MKFFTEELMISLTIPQYQHWKRRTRLLYLLDTLLMLREIICSRLQLSVLVDCSVYFPTHCREEVNGVNCGDGSRYAVRLLPSVELRVSRSYDLDEITCEIVYYLVMLFSNAIHRYITSSI